jgi:hypothetical protein
VAANGRNGPVVSDSSGFERKLVRWCRIRPVVSDWSVGFSVGFSRWESRGGSFRRADMHVLRLETCNMGFGQSDYSSWIAMSWSRSVFQ